jgi:hypothetical protein
LQFEYAELMKDRVISNLCSDSNNTSSWYGHKIRTNSSSR